MTVGEKLIKTKMGLLELASYFADCGSFDEKEGLIKCYKGRPVSKLAT